MGGKRFIGTKLAAYFPAPESLLPCFAGSVYSSWGTIRRVLSHCVNFSGYQWRMLLRVQTTSNSQRHVQVVISQVSKLGG